MSIEEGVAAAELTALNVLATIERELGDLDQVACWLKINGYVNAVPGFTEQARVVNGFSDLILELYGIDKLRRARPWACPICRSACRSRSTRSSRGAERERACAPRCSRSPPTCSMRGSRTVADNVQHRAGAGGITLAAAYHDARDVFPHNPRRVVYFQEPGAVFFQPTPERFRDLKLQPVVSRLIGERDLVAELVSLARQRDLDANAWVVLLHVDRGRAIEDMRTATHSATRI